MGELLGVAFLAWPLVLVVLILLAFIVAIPVSVVIAGRIGFNKWAGAFIGLLIVYLAFFWDWIPMVVAQKYYCEKEAGFWIHKSLDQWKAENPGVAETLVRNTKRVSVPGGYALNQRLQRFIKEERYFPLNYMIRSERAIVDSKTGEVLARYVDFSAWHQRREAGWAGWKFWLNRPHCVGGEHYESLIWEYADSFDGGAK